MDWTIVVSVLLALLLWPVVLASVGALVFLTAATLLRGRFQGLIERKMAHCMQMFSAREPEAAAAGAAEPWPCAKTSEGR